MSRILENIIRELDGDEWSPAEFRSIVQLGLHANWNTGETWIMQATLAKETGLNKSTICAAIKKAEKQQILSRRLRSRHGNMTTYFYCFAPRLLKRVDAAAEGRRDAEQTSGHATQTARGLLEEAGAAATQASDRDQEHRGIAEADDPTPVGHSTVPLSRNRTNSENLLREQGDHNGGSGPSQPDGQTHPERKRRFASPPPAGDPNSRSLQPQSEDPAESYPRRKSRFSELRKAANEDDEATRVEPPGEPTTSTAASANADLDDLTGDELPDALDKLLDATLDEPKQPQGRRRRFAPPYAISNEASGAVVDSPKPEKR